jgi:predicted negative regulator of RcsB-dependent stress response
MKSEERHHLQTNYLADKLGGTIETARPYTQLVVGGAVALVVGLLGWGLYSSMSRKSAASAWTEYYFSMTQADPESFKEVADKHPSSSAALWALQTAGDEQLAQGIDALYRDRQKGEDLIGNAIDNFEKVNSKAYQTELRTRAQLGLAKAHESLGEIDKAKDYYQQVAASGFQTTFTAIANSRLAFLNSPSGKEFYTWFSSLKPASAMAPKIDLNKPSSSPDLQFNTPAPINTKDLPLPDQTATPPATNGSSTDLKLDLPPVNQPASPGTVPAATTTPSTETQPAPNDSTAPAAPEAPK